VTGSAHCTLAPYWSGAQEAEHALLHSCTATGSRGDADSALLGRTPAVLTAFVSLILTLAMNEPAMSTLHTAVSPR